MSLFSTYNTIIEQKLANTSEVFYDASMKRQAANDTTKELLQEYDLAEMTVRSTQTFTVGIGVPPADYFRMIKLWATDTNGVEQQEYLYVVPDAMDKMSTTDSYYWTEDYNVAAAADRFIIRPTSVTSLNIRYIQIPTSMTADGVDNGISSQWDEVIALGSAMRLFQISNRWKEAQELERLYKALKAKTYLSVKNRGGIKQGNRLKSRFERLDYLDKDLINKVTTNN